MNTAATAAEDDSPDDRSVLLADTERSQSLDRFVNLRRWFDAIKERPAVRRGTRPE